MGKTRAVASKPLIRPVRILLPLLGALFVALHMCIASGRLTIPGTPPPPPSILMNIEPPRSTPTWNERKTINSPLLHESRINETGQEHVIYNVSQMLFLHVGKTGGETIKRVLHQGCQSIGLKQKRNGCLKQLPSSRLSDTVKYYGHYDRLSPRDVRRSDGYLISIRNPLSRALSWYSYMDPTNCIIGGSKHWSPSCVILKTDMMMTERKQGSWAYQFFTCFPRVEHWAAALTMRKNKSVSHVGVNCTRLAWETFEGSVPLSEHAAGHMTRNLEWYASRSVLKTFRYRQKIQAKKPVFVVRTEHLWDDMVAAERSLGGKGTFGKIKGSVQSHGSERYTGKLNNEELLGVEARANICCAMKNEFEVYKRVLFQAVNLNKVEQESTWSQTLQSCGFDSPSMFVTRCAQLHRATR